MSYFFSLGIDFTWASPRREHELVDGESPVAGLALEDEPRDNTAFGELHFSKCVKFRPEVWWGRYPDLPRHPLRAGSVQFLGRHVPGKVRKTKCKKMDNEPNFLLPDRWLVVVFLFFVFDVVAAVIVVSSAERLTVDAEAGRIARSKGREPGFWKRKFYYLFVCGEWYFVGWPEWEAQVALPCPPHGGADESNSVGPKKMTKFRILMWIVHL